MGQRFCAAHTAAQSKARDQAKTNQHYNSRRWRALRKAVLAKEPLCRDCMGHGVVTAAEVADHIVPLVDGGSDALDNLQSLCLSCHNAKTQREIVARSRSARRG